METEASRALREEKERQWKAEHRMELEAELAGDLERQWKEIAEERKLRAEVSGSPCMVSGRDKLVGEDATDACTVTVDEVS